MHGLFEHFPEMMSNQWPRQAHLTESGDEPGTGSAGGCPAGEEAADAPTRLVDNRP